MGELEPVVERADTEDGEAEEAAVEVGMLLRFSKHDLVTRNVAHFYQRTLQRGHRISHCSVSDDYVAYSIIEESATASEVTDAFGPQDTALAGQTSIVVLNIQTKKEVTIANPSHAGITAVYVDEGLLMIGSFGKIYEVKPSTLFEEGQPSRISAEKFLEMSSQNDLPDKFSTHSEIYAFWHTKNSTTVEVYTKSLRRMAVHIFRYRAQEGRAKLARMRTGREQR